MSAAPPHSMLYPPCTLDPVLVPPRLLPLSNSTRSAYLAKQPNPWEGHVFASWMWPSLRFFLGVAINSASGYASRVATWPSPWQEHHRVALAPCVLELFLDLVGHCHLIPNFIHLLKRYPATELLGCSTFHVGCIYWRSWLEGCPSCATSLKTWYSTKEHPGTSV